MQLPGRLYHTAPQDDDSSFYTSHELPRFSFEGHDRRLISTERLFHNWRCPDEENAYKNDLNALDDSMKMEKDIISRKWVVTLLVSMFTFISPFSSTMVTPALPIIADDFDIPEGFMQQLVMTIFLLGYAQGPFLLAPLSEIYGRVAILQYANLIYLVFNTACSFAKIKEQMLAFRFVSGIGGAAPQALCSGVLADTWRKEERGKGQTIYGMLTWISPCVAPICSAYISRVIVRKALTGIRKRVVVRTEYETSDRFSKILRKRLILPFVMMFTHPATQVPSIIRAYLYGVMYLMLSTFPLVFEEVYDMDAGPASLNYLSMCIGFMIGLQISHPLMDGLYARLKIYYGLEEGLPEFRVPPMLIAGILCPIGLFIYAWTAQARVHWIAPNIGCGIVAIGMIVGFQCSQAYTTDAYEAKHAASAAAVGAFLRTMCGFSFPLFSVQVYEKFGLGWGNSLLAFLTLGIALLSPVLLWFYGAKLRVMSTKGLDQ
ncbi:MFS multidrug transporter-like protein [Bimuria novae-zelandiae CBS 107.79]|uniref:MFS multidrug transporter-like protein n=1 Tax=Bimuria novae-zelandiae CBS 107.79 TaxID=1447943 RepID=A0A6A5VDZ2_9PLEO|nr:MFS multidrug transporter-like protein [Bimuria novae-zelandiae CBS 107.79]